MQRILSLQTNWLFCPLKEPLNHFHFLSLLAAAACARHEVRVKYFTFGRSPTHNLPEVAQMTAVYFEQRERKREIMVLPPPPPPVAW